MSGLSEELKNKHKSEGFDETGKLQKNYEKLIEEVRDYLNSFDVIEE